MWEHNKKNIVNSNAFKSHDNLRRRYYHHAHFPDEEIEAGNDSATKW